MEIVEIELTDIQLLKIAKEASKLHAQMLIKEAEFSVVKRSYKLENDANQDTMNELLDCIETGKREVEVECIVVMNYDTNQVEYFYQSQIVKRRPMTEFERKQQELR